MDPLDDLETYRLRYMDARFWRPYVQAVGRKHSLTCHSVRCGVPGTCPTFIVDDRWVAKFYGRLFDGASSYRAELEANRLLMGCRVMPAPALLAWGQLLTDQAAWPWPYLIFAYVPGVSIGEVYHQVALRDKLALARELGEMTRRLHRLSLDGSQVFSPTWDAYASLLQGQRAVCQRTHVIHGALPAHLVEQIDAYLPPLDALVERRVAPHLIHADLTKDHILGRLDDGCWRTLAVIDYGDAMVADLTYELVALHLDLFQGDKRLLRVYLEAYGLDEEQRAAFPHRAMSVTLLHRFNVLAALSGHVRVQRTATLGQLATLLWDVDAAGLDD